MLAICVVLRVVLSYRSADVLLNAAPYMVISGATPIVVLIGTLRHRPPHRSGWFLLAAAQVCYAVADGMTVAETTCHPTTPTTPPEGGR